MEDNYGNHVINNGPHIPAQSWSYRVPSPPRIFVPPPMVNEYGTQSLSIVNPNDIQLDPSGFGSSEFLKTVTYGHFRFREHVLDWKYEERRTAQEILPFIFLGSVSAARDRAFLESNQISMVLAVRNTSSAQIRLLAPKTPGELGISVANIDVADSRDLIAKFPEAIDMINNHLSDRYRQLQQADINQSGNGVPKSQVFESSNPFHQNDLPGKVLVFCESGNERSAALVVAYIMTMYSKSLVEALQIVQSQRFCVSVDDGMRFLLRAYEDILDAKRDVTRSRLQTEATRGRMMSTDFMEASSSRSRKRAFDNTHYGDTKVDDEVAEMMDGMRFEQRQGFAPFTEGGT